MAVYSAIDNSEIDQDSPVTQPLLLKYRENMVAQAEGAAGSPGVTFAALGGPSPGNVTIDQMHQKQHSNTSYTLLEVWNVYQTGTYRISLTLFGGLNGATLYARVYRNGVAHGAERSVSGNGVTQTYHEDLAFDAGDTIEIYSRNSTSTAGSVMASISIDQAYHVNIHCPEWGNIGPY